MATKKAKNNQEDNSQDDEYSASVPMPGEKGAKRSSEEVEIKKLKIQRIEVPIFGTSSLIRHAWSQKEKQEMLDKQMKKAKVAKSAKNPDQDYHDSVYWDQDHQPVFPAIAFKASAVNAAIAMDAKKTNLRQSFHVLGDMIPILTDMEPNMREDMVRIGMGTADLRYRGEFMRWGAFLPINLNTSLLSIEQLMNLFNAAGFGTGVGEWRPQRDGNHGMFKCADSDEISLMKEWQTLREKNVKKYQALSDKDKRDVWVRTNDYDSFREGYDAPKKKAA